MKIKYTILFLILLSTAVFASPDIIVNKYDTGFTLIPKNFDSQVCECGNLEDEYLIENLADVKTAYTITNDLGLAQNFNEIVLKPGQKALLVVSAPLECSSEDFSYKITAVSSIGITRTVERLVSIEKCQNLQLSMNETGSLLPNSTLTKKVQIINTGDYEELYTISSKKLNQYVKNETYQVIIPAGKSQTINFVYEFPPGFYGNKTLKFEAKAEINNLKAVLEEDFTILNDYDFSVNSDEITVCTEINKEFEIIINNEGAINNVFKINKLTGRGYTLSAEELIIEAGESEKIIITPQKYKPASEELRLQITQEYGDKKALIEIPIEVINCYDLSIEMPERIQHCGGEESYNIILNNTGLLEQEVAITTSNGNVNEPYVFLNPGEKKVVELELEEAVGEIKLNVSSARGTEYFSIPAKVESKCSIPVIEKDYFVERNNYAQLIIPIKNLGMEEGTFELSIDNDAVLDKEEITLIPGIKENLLLSVDLSVRNFGTYVFNLEIGDSTHEIVIDYKDKTMFQKGIIFANQNPCLYLLGSMLIITFIALMLWIFIPEKGKGSVKVTGIIMILLILITAGLLVGIKGAPPALYPELESEPNDLYFEAYSDEALIINMQNFFTDEDNDELSYSIDGDVKYTIINGEASITAEPGTYTINFVASDGEEETLSPGIVVNIKTKPQLNPIEIIKRYSCWMSWLLLVLTAIFLIGTMIKLSENPENAVFEKPEFKEEKPKKKSAKKKAAKKVAKKTTKKKTKKKVSKKKPKVNVYNEPSKRL